MHMALQGASCMNGRSLERGSNHSSRIYNHIHEQRDGTITFEATLLRWFLMASINDGLMESREGRMRSGRLFKKRVKERRRGEKCRWEK